MEPVLIPAFLEPLLAAMPQLSEKPRLGFTTRNQAWNPGFNVCNSTVAMGLQFACSKTVYAPVDPANNGDTITTFTATKALTEVGAGIGSLFGPEGTLIGAVVGSQLGLGANISWVSSTHSLYFGPNSGICAGTSRWWNWL